MSSDKNSPKSISKPVTKSAPKVDMKSAPKPVDLIGIDADEAMSEAGRKLFAYHFARLTQHEPEVRLGRNTEAIHDMRVATRRLRSLLQLFRSFYERDVIKTYRKTLSQLAKALGNVRDVDVLRHATEQYLKDSGQEPGVLASLLDHWKKQVDNDRVSLLDLLDSQHYEHFTAHFEIFLATPGQAALPPQGAQPYLVRHVAPRLIYTQYTTVRAYERIIDSAALDTLHALRIRIKALRYTLESFQEVLQPEIAPLITATRGLQDHLGNLQDARIASQRLHEYIDTVEENQPLAALLQYMAAREDEKHRLLTEIPQAWATFTKPALKRALALSVSAL